MSLRLREVALHLDQDESELGGVIASSLGMVPDDINSWTIVRKAVDARKKSDILRVYTVDFNCRDEAKALLANRHLQRLLKTPVEIDYSVAELSQPTKVLVVGMGPAGLFSALTLAEAGAEVVLVDRGRPVEQRWDDVRAFWNGSELNCDSNTQFGEGGAGTFSDGKLTCRVNHPATRMLLRRFVEFGAPSEILVQAKPHIGSNRLRAVLVNMRTHLQKLGVDIRFSCRLNGIELKDGKVFGAVVNGDQTIDCNHLVLATGHSARDTYEMLENQGIRLESKPFAVGLRVEHPLELINKIQYGIRKHVQLPAADYRLAWNDPESGRGVYSFCMCPGGMVVNAASESGGLVVNGMSDHARNNPYSNSALVVSVSPDDFGDDHPLAGIRFQRDLENQAFRAGGSNWRAPAQSLLEFVGQKRDATLSETTCRPGVTRADLVKCLPDFVGQALKKALPVFNQRMRGFICPEAVLIGVETRTSSPVRILRDRNGEADGTKGLYPAGEGAGYAGGIMSAALDGMSIAEKIIERTNES